MKEKQYHKYTITSSSENIEDWRKCETKGIGLAMQPRVLCFSLNMLRFPFLYSYYLNVSFHFDDKKEEKILKGRQ